MACSNHRAKASKVPNTDRTNRGTQRHITWFFATLPAAGEVKRYSYAGIVGYPRMKLSNSFSGALRTFAYFMASGSQNTLEGINYLGLYGEEPSAFEQVFAIYANVLELDEDGNVLNAKYVEKRATNYLCGNRRLWRG